MNQQKIYLFAIAAADSVTATYYLVNNETKHTIKYKFICTTKEFVNSKTFEAKILTLFIMQSPPPPAYKSTIQT